MKEILFLNWRRASLLNRFSKDQRGQVLPWTAFLIILMLGVGALALDFGRAYIAFHQLQSSADAASLAGAEQLPNTTAATWAQHYSAGSGGLNGYSWMGNVTVTVTPKCLSTLTNAGIACIAPSNANALQVTESVNLPTYFARLFGMNTIPVAFQSTAAMRGSTSSPYNIVVILDTTASMASTDNDSQCNSTRLACAVTAIQQGLLESPYINPCTGQYQAANGNCGVTAGGVFGSADVANPLDEVALFTFPTPTTGTVADDYGCSGLNPTTAPYSYPSPTGTSYAPSSSPGSTPTYMVVGFSSDYRQSNTSTTMYSQSNLVKALGGNGCRSMGDPGGQGTYYAGVLYAAQAALLAEQSARSGSVLSQNVIILVSDGDATACYKNGSINTCGTKASQMSATGMLSNGSYPSYVDECSQAIVAAKAIAAAGTRVYSVAYGAAATGGCTSDTTGTYAGYQPCQVMQNIASQTDFFFSDYTATANSGACISASQATSSLKGAINDIAASLSDARLIPNGTP